MSTYGPSTCTLVRTTPAWTGARTRPTPPRYAHYTYCTYYTYYTCCTHYTYGTYCIHYTYYTNYTNYTYSTHYTYYTHYTYHPNYTHYTHHTCCTHYTHYASKPIIVSEYGIDAYDADAPPESNLYRNVSDIDLEP